LPPPLLSSPICRRKACSDPPSVRVSPSSWTAGPPLLDFGGHQRHPHTLRCVNEIVAGNAQYWEQLAPHRMGCSADEIRAFEPLDALELDAMGALRGKRCLQVAASVGDEALQMALMGAEVTAVDIAPSHVERGRGKAKELGVDIDFRVGDMTDLPLDVSGFDVIYISGGGLCWVPDLTTWVRDMSDRLAPGGRLVIAEHHPLWEVLSATGDGTLRVNGSYFEPRFAGRHDADKAPQIIKELDGIDSSTSTHFVWSLGSVVTALIGAGLTIRMLRELPDDDMFSGVDGGDEIPAIYIAAASKP
jgi:2-polyprenyl-3-methyl-5-hydroxy-6-metoxy-1,4-benzoquinol methylase